LTTKRIHEIAILNRKTISSKNIPKSIYYLDTGNITKNKINELKFLELDIEKYPSRAQRIVQDKTIIYSAVRPNQEHYGFLENPLINLIVSTGFTTLDVIDKDIEPKYLYYLLTQKEITNYLHMIGQNSVSSYPSINPSDLGFLKFKFPEKSIQQKIVNVLSSLDSKIELNNKINKELESMAKTFYDYWFVQFDFPDENGKPYKSSGGKMVYNKELKREIPEGWEVKNLEEICEIYQPQTISEKEMIKDGKYYVFGANGIVGMYDKYNHEDSEVTVTCRGNSCGTLNRTLPYSWITGNSMVIKFKDDKIHNEYLMHFLSWTKMDNVITGSAQPQITRANLAPLKFLIPEAKILDNFSQKMEFNINLQLKNIEQNQKLSKLRDWLLPMLMNGQVRVK